MKAAENVIDYKVQQLNQDPDETSLATKDKSAARKIRTRYGIDRLVEDKIQESMAKGDFDNLPNAGKPLKFQNHNPFVDNVTHKLNQVLIESGYAPEWVMLEREIRDDKLRITRKMETFRSRLGMSPLAEKEEVSITCIE
ncbi:UNVERIFIED_CONTAM: hypothetical protein GTU68_058095, partial [Idotea baltica]|nr:hypothetical protein [Idotea baltica]